MAALIFTFQLFSNLALLLWRLRWDYDTRHSSTGVQFLQYPSDRERSVEINSYADPQLTSEAIQAQGAQVDVVTGATDSSDAFMQSLADALSQAQA